MIGRWPQLLLQKDGVDYLLASVEITEYGYFKCYWTKDRSNDYMNNKIRQLGKLTVERQIEQVSNTLQMYRSRLIKLRRFDSDQLIVVG